MASAVASTGAVPFWRAAGMTYITYSNICASLVRNCLKEPHKTEAISREKVHFAVSKWADGKPQKPNLGSRALDELGISGSGGVLWDLVRIWPPRDVKRGILFLFKFQGDLWGDCKSGLSFGDCSFRSDAAFWWI
ncbi:hypothetical protein HHK36_026016 [Tetracentron sinense]|uniref:ATP synthase subunit epsilon, mitochondrial n=1 Tax=Tetracentron sinense TaxID=13715 RepID=A0A834YJ33_TETSI|nr:hypothetical protein HHK36_026016 [Tetracentron sinense]